MAKTRLVQIFPSAEFGLKQEDESVSLFWLIAYLTQIFQAIPKESQKSAMFMKWKGSLVQYEKTLTPVEAVAEGLGGIVTNLEQVIAANKGLSKEELVQLVESLQSL